MLLTDPEVESSLLISLDEGASYQKHSLGFDILSLLFHPEQEDWILAYSHDQKVMCRCLLVFSVNKPERKLKMWKKSVLVRTCQLKCLGCLPFTLLLQLCFRASFYCSLCKFTKKIKNTSLLNKTKDMLLFSFIWELEELWSWQKQLFCWDLYTDTVPGKITYTQWYFLNKHKVQFISTFYLDII